jgi:hypothetical protein
MKVIIAGSKSIVDLDYIEKAVAASGFDITEVVSGTAKGVDKLGEFYARRKKIRVQPFPADWKNIDVPGAVIRSNRYGKYNAIAGHMRNELMGQYADALIAVWDGISPGTRHMINYMLSLGKPVFVYNISCGDGLCGRPSLQLNNQYTGNRLYA